LSLTLIPARRAMFLREPRRVPFRDADPVPAFFLRPCRQASPWTLPRPHVAVPGAASPGPLPGAEFLPVAMATGARAEHHRPLATVVIAGATTSMLRILSGLPSLYRRLEGKKD
jgi:hypothetical protein